jgi:NADH-quinone oxidoreductase subunit H
MPIVALAAVVAAFLHLPLWSAVPRVSFEGSLIVVVYLLTIPTLTFFLAGWYSTSLYSTLGAVRTLTQLFAYEVPLLLAVLAPAILAGSWSLEGIARFFAAHPAYVPLNLLGFAVALVSLQGKLERIPFDIPEAETEIVGGTFTEYSGRLLAMFRLAIDMETVAGAALVAAVFLPFGYGLPPVPGFLLFVVKILAVVALLAVLRTVMARLRIEQMVLFCWKYLAPAALVQLVIVVLVNGMVRP